MLPTLQTARARVPSGVRLFYNDYGAEGHFRALPPNQFSSTSPLPRPTPGLNNKSQRVYDMVASMKQRGIPLDGVGLQMHVSAFDYPPFAEVAQNIQRLGNLGLEVHITEMDVNCAECTHVSGSGGMDAEG